MHDLVTKRLDELGKLRKRPSATPAAAEVIGHNARPESLAQGKVTVAELGRGLVRVIGQSVAASGQLVRHGPQDVVGEQLEAEAKKLAGVAARLRSQDAGTNGDTEPVEVELQHKKVEGDLSGGDPVADQVRDNADAKQRSRADGEVCSARLVLWNSMKSGHLTLGFEIPAGNGTINVYGRARGKEAVRWYRVFDYAERQRRFRGQYSVLVRARGTQREVADLLELALENAA